MRSDIADDLCNHHGNGISGWPGDIKPCWKCKVDVRLVHAQYPQGLSVEWHPVHIVKEWP